MSDIETEAVLEANEAFYRSMRASDLGAMNALWSRTRRVSCTHPQGPSLFGREAVMESWRVIFARAEGVPIHATGAHAVLTGKTAMILCREEVGPTHLIATNIFVREGDSWRMVNHQSAPVPGGTA
ncbi:nuclear transport factor 2 family protein [Limibaculum sp. M0105]|uniref:Nuclear transport factor 2 family protein n=1 Tax=Thermohalobaculum xanthum TaxID=2753746 RepID=A0A8J7SGU4_9RHOB|nr:nuclear transport factor 2 family protein [Thermohalobaculum xanthum]MBK0400377.1 nuclear transport factor 2 family protein [Thermohalobaculum xanthum]